MMQQKQKILFLTANPHITDGDRIPSEARRGAPDREASAIFKELRGSGYRDRFEFVTRWAAEPLDLLRALREIKPTVVHFSGHGNDEGLLFQGPNSEARRVPSAAIAETFAAFAADGEVSPVRLVVLSACHSQAPAEALLPFCTVPVAQSLE